MCIRDRYREVKKQMPEILYEDENILLFNKQPGLLSQRAKPSDISAVDCLIAYLLETGALTPEMLRTFRPSVCNRLDRNTSGILAAGKSLAGLQEMCIRDRNRRLKVWEDRGKEDPIGTSMRKPAVPSGMILSTFRSLYRKTGKRKR